MAKRTTATKKKPAPDPSTLSQDALDMEPKWMLIGDVQEGKTAVKARETTYLPQYPAEDDDEYTRRLAQAPWRPEFEDALNAMVAKPFTKDIQFVGAVPAPLKDFAEDVDGCGNNLTQFERIVFKGGVAKGLHGVLVDYPTMQPGLTLADERKSGARPYWCHIAPQNIIAVYWMKRNGRQVISHIRFFEDVTTRVGFEEETTQQIRVYQYNEAGQPIWEIWTKTDEGQAEWVLAQTGALSLTEIPIALFFVGERSSNFKVQPPLLSLAEMQIELYQALSRQEEILTFAGSPMLQAKGMTPPSPTKIARGPDGARNSQVPAPEIRVGPKTILYAPPGAEGVPTEWAFIQPDAATIQEVAAQVERVQKDMQRLGKKPLLPKESGDVTATATAVDAAEAHSEVSAWAMTLKDQIELCLLYTALWMQTQAEPEVTVNTDFGVSQRTSDLDGLLKMRAAGEITRETFWDECLRRGILAASFDKEKETRALEDEEAMAREVSIEDTEALAAAEAAGSGGAADDEDEAQAEAA
jgi:hypothetical protein